MEPDEPKGRQPPPDLPEDSLLSYNAGGSLMDRTMETLAAGVEADETESGFGKLRSGERLGSTTDERHFELRSVIGRGGMGEVWEAVQSTLKRVVAVKTIRSDSLARRGVDEQRLMLEVFEREALISGLLEHPNIVPVHDFSKTQDGIPLLAMKRVAGRPWDKIVAEDFRAKKPAEFLLKHLPILIDVAQAVAFAHSRGIIHRDIKPSQVMVGEFGEVLLMDWGLAIYKGAPGGPSSTEDVRNIGLTTLESASSPSGTPSMMAPEQTEDTAERVGSWTDVYLLGGCLYYLLCGMYPHYAKTAALAFLHASIGQVERPEEKAEGRDIPAELSRIVMQALAPEPEKRFASASEFAAALQDYLTGASRQRESMAILEEAEISFQAAQSFSQSQRGGVQAYAQYGQVLEKVTRALQLWSQNSGARRLYIRSLSAQALKEIEQGDLIVAEMHIAELERQPDTGKHLAQELRSTLETAQVSRERARRQRVAFLRVAVVLLILVIVAGGCSFYQAQQIRVAQAEARVAIERANEQSRLKKLFERANALRSRELELATAMGSEMPLPSTLSPRKEEGRNVFRRDEVARLLSQREALRLERAELIKAGLALDPEPYALMLADANLKLEQAASGADALAAYELYMHASEQRPKLPEPVIGMGIAAFRADFATTASTLLDRATTLTLELRGPESGDYSRVLAMTGEAFQEIEDSPEAYRSYYRRSINVLEPQWLDLSTRIGNLYGLMQQPRDALTFTTPTLHVARRVWKPDSGAYLNLLGSLTTYSLTTGNFIDGERFARENIDVRKKYRGPDDESLGSALNNLGGLYMNLSRYADAEATFKEALRVKHAAKKPDEVSIANTENVLAGLYYQLSRFDESEKYYRSALATRRKKLGSEHPKVADTLGGLGLVMSARNSKEGDAEAKALFTEAIDIFTKAFGPDHPAVARTIGNMINAGSDDETPVSDEDLKLLERAVRIFEKSVPGSNDLGSALLRYGIALKTRERFEEALQCMNRAVEITTAIYGNDNPSVLFAHRNKAIVLQRLKRLEEARVEYKISVDIARRVIAPNSVNRLMNTEAFCRISILVALDAEKDGHKERAMDMYREVIEYGTLYLNVRSGLGTLPFDLAVAHAKLGHRSEAEKSAQSIWEWNEKIALPSIMTYLRQEKLIPAEESK